jgi:ubiquinone/menaquinone biosynthesis C-methylase UbiE
MKLSEENIREKNFHNELQSRQTGRFENIFYRAIYNASEDFFKYLKLNSINAQILDYGCGIGSSIEEVIKFKPKKITGIDISEVSIQKAKDKNSGSEVELELLVGNCEKTEFQDNKFDIVYGTGILHHLKMSESLAEIHRVLKPGGSFLFIEPLGTNPLINLYRNLTPNSRSDDEHPLIKDDFILIKKKFFKTNIKYYGFLTLIFFPFYKSPKKSLIFKLLKNLDQFLFKLNIFKNLAWSVMIVATKN